MRSYFRQQLQQKQHLLLLLLVTVLIAASFLGRTAEARRAHKRFVIHIPYKVKTHHHTHTVYSLIQSGATKHQTVYKILGYSKHGSRVHNDYRDERGYPQRCQNHKSDMVFNNYARNDMDVFYPDVETLIEDEQRDEWDR